MPDVPITVAIADDHPIVLDGLEQLFRLEADVDVVARCSTGRAAIETVRIHAPDVLVLDVLMPHPDGLAVLRALNEIDLPTRVVILTAVIDDERLLEAIRLGAQGVVLKESAPQLLVEAVREVYLGHQWLEKGLGGRALRKLLQRETNERELARQLTRREMEILRLLVQGARNRTIADQLFISEGTVKVHLHNIYEKLGLGSRFELMAYARNRGLVY
jgi:DNA-binding NarL/FixJ family response regulator